MSTLRMQNYTIIGQGVLEISVRTNKQTQDEDLLYRFEFQRQNGRYPRIKMNFCLEQFG